MKSILQVHTLVLIYAVVVLVALATWIAFLFIDQHLAKICASRAKGAVLKRGGM